MNADLNSNRRIDLREEFTLRINFSLIFSYLS